MFGGHINVLHHTCPDIYFNETYNVKGIQCLLARQILLQRITQFYGDSISLLKLIKTSTFIIDSLNKRQSGHIKKKLLHGRYLSFSSSSWCYRLIHTTLKKNFYTFPKGLERWKMHHASCKKKSRKLSENF